MQRKNRNSERYRHLETRNRGALTETFREKDRETLEDAHTDGQQGKVAGVWQSEETGKQSEIQTMRTADTGRE